MNSTVTDAGAGGSGRGAPPEERLSDILPSLLPLAQQFLDNQRRELALREQALGVDAAREADERAVAARQWRWQMSLLAAACVAFLAIAGGLMFWVNEVDAGLLVVSHLVALGAGAVAAARWTRRTFEGTRDRM
jgi:hypothetical protein